MTDATFRRWLARLIELATVMLTSPATFRLLDSYGASWLEKVAGWLAIEGAFVAFWEWSKLPTQDKAGRTFRMAGLVAMYFVLLWVGLQADGFAAWPPRIAAGLWIAHDIVPVFTRWLQAAKQKRSQGDSLATFKQRVTMRQRKRAFRKQARAAGSLYGTLYRAELEAGIDREAKQIGSGFANPQGGSTTCTIQQLDDGQQTMWLAVCQVCNFRSSMFASERAAISSGNAHSKKHANEMVL